MSEQASVPAFSRRHLLLSGIAAIPAAAVIARPASRPGTAPAAKTPDRRPAWPLAADSAAQDSSGACDAYTDPHAPVDLLFVPEFGLYTKFGYAIDFIRQVHPKQASPVHDTGLDLTGVAGADGFLVQNRTPPFAPGTGSPFVRLPKGTPIEV